MRIEIILEWLEERGYDFVFVGNKQKEIDGFSSLFIHVRESSL